MNLRTHPNLKSRLFKTAIGVAIIVCVALGWFVIDVRSSMNRIDEVFELVEHGMAERQVIDLVGHPDYTDDADEFSLAWFGDRRLTDEERQQLATYYGYNARFGHSVRIGFDTNGRVIAKDRS